MGRWGEANEVKLGAHWTRLQTTEGSEKFFFSRIIFNFKPKNWSYFNRFFFFPYSSLAHSLNAFASARFTNVNKALCRTKELKLKKFSLPGKINFFFAKRIVAALVVRQMHFCHLFQFEWARDLGRGRGMLDETVESRLCDETIIHAAIGDDGENDVTVISMKQFKHRTTVN